MNIPHYLLIIPGLSDRTDHLQFIVSRWRSYGFEPLVFPFNWSDEVDLQTQLRKVGSLIDQLASKGLVSIIGISAGGSAAFNVLVDKPNKVHRAVSICGRLREGAHHWRSLDRMAATSHKFKQSVLTLEHKVAAIEQSLLSRMMTISARFGDELVPADTSDLVGAHNIKIPTAEHVFSSSLALTVFTKPIIEFILEAVD